jgi:cytochrome c-type biogenesis protein CcmH
MPTTFVFILAALLLIGGATFLVCRPLLRDAGRRARRALLGLALLVPVGAVSGYLLIGAPGPALEAASADAAARHDAAALEAAIAAQREHLAATPTDALGWVALGASLGGLGRWPEAEAALAHAYGLEPADAYVAASYAEAMAINAGRDLSGRPMELVRQALDLNPQDDKALELAAVHAYQQQELGKAAYYFRQLLKVLPEDSPYAEDIRAAMREARSRAEIAAFGEPAVGSAAEPAAPQ